MAEKSFREWSYVEVSDWLKENGLPDELCEKFEGEDLTCTVFALIWSSLARQAPCIYSIWSACYIDLRHLGKPILQLAI